MFEPLENGGVLMAERTGISWCDATFNPIIGCSKVSPACKHCYAERDMDQRYGKVAWGPNGTRVLTSDANWKKPLKWDREAAESGKRLRVFCASLADVFEDWKGPIWDHHGLIINVLNSDGSWTHGPIMRAEDVHPTINDVRRRLFALIDATPNLDWLLLTKRPENIRKMWPREINGGYLGIRESGIGVFERKNVWLGCSVENQEYADKRIPELLKCRDLSPVLFLSCEPLLGPVDLRPALWFEDQYFSFRETSYFRPNFWVIAGGESGPEARPSHPNWFRQIRDQCAAANVPFHFKQFGEWFPSRAARHSDLSADANKQIILRPDGQVTTGFLEYGIDAYVMDRVGVKQGGRMLDGVLHDAFPEVQHAS